MAEIAVSLLKVTLERLGSPITEELWLFCCVHKDIEKLRNTLSVIMGVLSDAEEKQQTNMGVKIWLKQLKEAAYDAANILDECQTEALRRKLETEGRVINKVRDFFSASNPRVFDLLMAHKVKDIRERLREIAEEGNRLGLRVGERSSGVTSREEMDSHVIESDVKGREKDQNEIVDLLLNMRNEERVFIISIVGMGGLGKTTLAQLVHKDARVKEQFDDRFWVCVSDDYDMPRLTKKIIESATGSKCDDDNMELLQGRLQDNLRGKKFLLVLDDVRNKKPFNWERFKSFLQAGEMGSKILVTTRSQQDASIVGTHHLYLLSELSEDDCWYLFRQRAFGQGQEEDSKLVDIGKEIVKKCDGVPLAVKALGSLMRSKRAESEWISVKESELCNNLLLEEHDSIFPVLRLSYNHLPSHLKPCFAYCSIFRKDHRIQVEKLIQLWMAEGFIQPSRGSKPTEEAIGRGYFNDLLGRSFFQDAEKDDDGNAVSCQMHDLMHDLAELVSEDARSIVSEDGKITIPDGCRHLSVEIRAFQPVSITLVPSNGAKKLRTLLLTGYGCDTLTHLPCLRVLDFALVQLSEDMLNSISGLKQLRYLCLGILEMPILPNSLTQLYNLQTLKLRHCWRLNELPRDMRKMINLRHLQIDGCQGLTHMPAKMGELTFLQTLPVFIVDKDSGCNIRQLGKLKYLSGELEIQNLENVTDAVNAREAELRKKANLRSLGLSWSRSIADAAELSEQILEGLRPHPNLRCLRVENYGGERLPHWMGCCDLPNLVELSLRNCSGWEQEQLPPLAQFRLLKSLRVSGMVAVKRIGSSFSGDDAFSSLERLTLEEMPNLEEWFVWNDGREAVLPRLKTLEVRRCPKLTSAKTPCFPLLSSLALSGFDAESLSNRFFQNQLTHLRIEYCQNLESLLRELGNVAATLEELRIHDCPKLVSLFPEETQNYPPRLRNLQIWRCYGLASLRLQGLGSLTDLLIGSCKNLASFVGGLHHLTAVQRLDIFECPELVGEWADGMEHLTSFTSLSIIGCAQVTHLPEGLKHATRLRYLDIQLLPNLSALPDWIGNLSSLQHLCINKSPNLVSLPSGFQHLTNLQRLGIFNCPQLEKRCENERGEDWHKICHIPEVHIRSFGSERQSHGRQLQLNSCWISIRIMWTAILNSFWALTGVRHD